MNMVVLGIVLLIALFDIVVGLRLLFSAKPYDVNGSDTVWATATPPLWQSDRKLLESLYRRLGAFSLHAGVVTAVWGYLSWEQPKLMLALLVTYMVTGLAFSETDWRYFKGTRYWAVKALLGSLWFCAFVFEAFTR